MNTIFAIIYRSVYNGWLLNNLTIDSVIEMINDTFFIYSHGPEYLHSRHSSLRSLHFLCLAGS